MPRGLLPPTLGRISSDLDERISRLERRTRPGPPAKPSPAIAGPIVVVASSSTAPDRQAQAKYVCDGTADDVEINAALNSLKFAGGKWGGTVLLLEGDYSLAASIRVPYGANLVGCGMEATFLQFDDNGDAGPLVQPTYPYDITDYAMIVDNYGGVVSDFYLGVLNTSGTGYRGGIYFPGHHMALERVHIEVDGNPDVQPIQNPAVFPGGEYVVIRQCHIVAWNGVAVDWGSDKTGLCLLDSHIEAATGLDINGTAEGQIVARNIFEGSSLLGSAPWAGMTGGGAHAFALNAAIACFAGGGGGELIVDNRIEYGFRTGILLADVDDVRVSGNFIRTAADNGGSAIQLRTGTYNCMVTDNKVRPRNNQWTYGIEIQAGALDNLVTNNDLAESAITPFLDNGTRTITQPGNRPGGVTMPTEHHLHIQGSPSAVWTITHNLGWEPGIAVVDSAGDEVMGTVHHVSLTQLTVTFSGAFSGRATLS